MTRYRARKELAVVREITGVAANGGIEELNQDERLKLKTEKEIFLNWLCTPRAQRQPRTQIELARMLKVHVITLSTWKQSREFWTDFVRCLRSHIIHRIPEATGSLVTQAKGGHRIADRLFLDTLGPKAWLGRDSQEKDSHVSFEEALRQASESIDPPSWMLDEPAESEDCSDTGGTAGRVTEI